MAEFVEEERKRDEALAKQVLSSVGDPLLLGESLLLSHDEKNKWCEANISPTLEHSQSHSATTCRALWKP